MGELGTAWRAVLWQSPSRELADARRGVDRRTLHRVRTAVVRGEAVSDPRDPPLAVATARQYLRGTITSRWAVGLFALFAVACAAEGVRAALDGYFVPAVLFASVAVCRNGPPPSRCCSRSRSTRCCSA